MRVSSLPVAAMLVFLLIPATAQSYSFVETSDGVPVWWDADSVDWRLDDLGTGQLSLSAVENALRTALDAWDGVPESSLAVAYGGLIEDPTVGYQQGSNINIVTFVGANWAYGSQAVAITLTTWSVPSGNLLDADILVNTQEYNWATDGTVNRLDVASALAHELGHAVGLGHSETLEATMYASMMAGELQKRQLHVDDENGYRFLYNAQDVVEPDPEDDEPTPDPIDESQDDDPAPAPSDDPQPGPGSSPAPQPSGDPQPPADDGTPADDPSATPGDDSTGDAPADQAGPSTPGGDGSLGEDPTAPTTPQRRSAAAPAGNNPAGMACSATGTSGVTSAGLGLLMLGLVTVRRRTGRSTR